MAGDGAGTDVERRADLPVGAAGGEELNHLQLARGQTEGLVSRSFHRLIRGGDLRQNLAGQGNGLGRGADRPGTVRRRKTRCAEGAPRGEARRVVAMARREGRRRSRRRAERFRRTEETRRPVRLAGGRGQYRDVGQCRRLCLWTASCGDSGQVVGEECRGSGGITGRAGDQPEVAEGIDGGPG